jgi:hypothetical protein
VKKLAKNAQTVFTESPCQRLHTNGLADAKKCQKKKAKINKLKTNRHEEEMRVLNIDTVFVFQSTLASH